MIRWLISNRLKIRYILWNRFLIRYKKVSYTTFPNINGKLRLFGRGKLHLGRDVQINSGLISNPIGGDTQTVISVDPGAELTIDDYTGISNCAIICKLRITIGKFVKIGGGVKIYDSDFHHLDSKERKNPETDVPRKMAVHIGDHCFIGAHSIILKGVEIGENSIIGSGSVVAKSIPPNEIWGGNPAKFIRKIED